MKRKGGKEKKGGKLPFSRIKKGVLTRSKEEKRRFHRPQTSKKEKRKRL
jgi:hypothetical protein